MDQTFEEKEVYVLLDFQGQDTALSQQENVVFKILNLNESKPIVQLGVDVYEGTYEDAIGTNVYFEENKNFSENNIFECKTPISLQYVLKQSKVLKMNKLGTRKKFIVSMNPSEAVNIQFKEDYKVLLDKYEKGILNIEDCIVSENGKEIVENVIEVDSRPKPQSSSHDDWCTKENDHNDTEVLTSSLQCCSISPSKKRKISKTRLYQDLQRLVSKPLNYKTNRDLIKEYLCKESTSKNDFAKWKSYVLESILQQPIKLDIKKGNMEDFVDIKQSIQDGIIINSDRKSGAFTKKEKRDLLSFKNFINVSPLMKLLMLTEYLKVQKLKISKMNQEKLNARDEDSYTFVEKFELLKKFKLELKSHIMSRFQEASTKEAPSEFELELSDDDDEYFNDTDASTSSFEELNSDEEDSNCDVSEADRDSKVVD